MEAPLPRFVAVHGNAPPDSPFTMYTTMTGGDDNDTQVIDPNDSQHAFQLEPIRDGLPIRPIRRSTLTAEEDINSIDWSEFEDLDWAPSMTKAAKRLTKVLSDASSEGDPTKMDKNAKQDSHADLQGVKEQIQEIHTMLATLLLEKKGEDGDGNRGPLRSTSPTRSISPPRTRTLRHARSSSSKNSNSDNSDNDDIFAYSRSRKSSRDSTINSESTSPLRTRSPPRTRTIRHARSSSSKNNSSEDDDIFAYSRSTKSRDSTINSDILDISFRSQKSRSRSSKTNNDSNNSNPLDSSFRSRKSDRIRRSHALNSSAQRVLDRCSPYEGDDLKHENTVRTSSTKSYSNSIDSEGEDSLLDERLERDYGIPRRLGGHNSFQPGMQHFVYHPSRSNHFRTYHYRSSFDGHQSDPVLNVSQSHHSRTTPGGFDGSSSEPILDFKYREPPKSFKAIPRPPLANGAPSPPTPLGAGHRSKSFNTRKQASPDSTKRPNNKATKSDQKGRRHSKRNQKNPIAGTVSTSPES